MISETFSSKTPTALKSIKLIISQVKEEADYVIHSGQNIRATVTEGAFKIKEISLNKALRKNTPQRIMGKVQTVFT